MDPIQQQPLPPLQDPAAAAPPPVPTNAQQAQPQQPTSILERLRQQVARELMPDPVEEMQRRARTFGAALMGTRGDFFQGLAAGQQALEQQRAQEQQARTARLQQMEQEAQRQAEQALRQAEFEYNRDPTNPTNQLRLAQARQALAEVAQGRRPTVREFLDDQGRVVLVNVETGQEIRRTGLRPTQELRLQARPLGAADFARLRDRATAQALREIPSIPGVTDPPARIEQRTARANQLFDEYVRAEESGRALQTGGTGAGGAGTQTAPTTPSRVLQYSGPQPQPQQQ